MCKTNFVVFEGSLDPRCPNPTPTATAPTYLPPVTTKLTTSYADLTTTRVPTTTNATPTPTERRTTLIPSTTTARPTTQLRCYPGSPDPRCPRISTTAAPKTTTFKARCYPGSLDPNCSGTQTTTTRVTPRPTTTRVPIPSKPQCYPGKGCFGTNYFPSIFQSSPGSQLQLYCKRRFT